MVVPVRCCCRCCCGHFVRNCPPPGWTGTELALSLRRFAHSCSSTCCCCCGRLSREDCCRWQRWSLGSQSGSQAGSQSGSQAVRQAVSRSVRQSSSQAVRQSVRQAVRQSVSQSISQSVRRKGQVSVRLGKLGLRRVRISVR